MAPNFTIENFIENRWADAKDELSRRDASFVSTVEAYRYLGDHGFSLPDQSKIPKPSKPLDEAWYALLEATFDVDQALERLGFTSSLIDLNPTGRMVTYSIDTLYQDAYSLCEKVKVLITYSSRLFLGSRLKGKYRRLIDTRVQNKVRNVRRALVHGADDPSVGDPRVRATAITRSGLGWEMGVVLGIL